MVGAKDWRRCAVPRCAGQIEAALSNLRKDAVLRRDGKLVGADG
jgi:hypothetical protein